MKKRALVVGMGALRGAYDAGAVAELCRQLGPDYFDALYGCSAGSYAVTFFTANQPDVIENVWRNYVDGQKLIHYLNPLKKREILNLTYLTHTFRNEPNRLKIDQALRSRAPLTYVLTEYETGKSVFVNPNERNIFDLMTASSAIPLLHSPKLIDGVKYIDGSLSDPLPFTRALADGNEEVVIVYNKPCGFFVGERYDMFSPMLASFMPSQIRHLVTALKPRFHEIEQALERGGKHLKIIRPSRQLPLKSIVDSNKARLNACVDMGIADAKEFLKTYHAS